MRQEEAFKKSPDYKKCQCWSRTVVSNSRTNTENGTVVRLNILTTTFRILFSFALIHVLLLVFFFIVDLQLVCSALRDLAWRPNLGQQGFQGAKAQSEIGVAGLKQRVLQLPLLHSKTKLAALRKNRPLHVQLQWVRRLRFIDLLVELQQHTVNRTW